MRRNKFFWSAKEVSYNLNIPLERIIEFVGTEIMPAPVLVGDAPMWERVKILKWARDLKPCDPNKARAALWEVFQEHNDPDAPCTPARVR